MIRPRAAAMSYGTRQNCQQQMRQLAGEFAAFSMAGAWPGGLHRRPRGSGNPVQIQTSSFLSQSLRTLLNLSMRSSIFSICLG